jgi:hypothetical protein
MMVLLFSRKRGKILERGYSKPTAAAGGVRHR